MFKFIEKIARTVLNRPWHYIPMPSFDAAAKAAGVGYLDERILTETKADDDIGVPALTGVPDFFGPFFTMLSLASLDKFGAPLRVLDFGGATGDYFHYAKAMFGGHVPLEWHVVETEMYVRRGQDAGGPVAFHTSIDDVPQPDVAMFSGSLHFLKDWKTALTRPKVLASRTVYISRTPVGPTYAPFLQKVFYGKRPVQYAGAVLPLGEVTAALSDTHELFASFRADLPMNDLGSVSHAPMIWRLRRPARADQSSHE